MPDADRTEDRTQSGRRQTDQTRAERRKSPRVFLAGDADPRVTEPVEALSAEQGVDVVKVPSMKELGSACGIAVGSAVAALLR